MFLPAASDPWQPNYGCFVANWGCQASQAVAGFMASIIRNLGDFIGTMIAGAFNTNIDANSWNVAHSQFLFWVAVTSPVILIIALFQIAVGMILQDWQRIGRTAIGAAVAIPFSALCVWGMQQFSNVTDDVTESLTTAAQGGSIQQALLRVVGLIDLPSSAVSAGMQGTDFMRGSPIYQLVTSGAANQNAIGNYFLALFIVAIMTIATLFLFIAMSIREFGLLALAAMAPVALMMIGQPKLGAWAQRWASLTTGLLLAKPLAAGVVLLAIQLTRSADSIGVLLVAAGAVIAASFSPLWATRLVSFAGAEVGTALHRRISMREQFSRVNTAGAPMRALVKLGGH
ncbi:hypothetical protein HII28_13235 [Planctomonas sp. JC2975]|uniref:hypothetical protein n=1 Tax=Planctomonas sp. JC2975 TaxID=2729626 RepID=UPI001474EA32|nr:hypothetical protein [Planctomonas sp. JC2975]NNC12838.1 hypothetical protein [Planctomonas sp. JC2975]